MVEAPRAAHSCHLQQPHNTAMALLGTACTWDQRYRSADSAVPLEKRGMNTSTRRGPKARSLCQESPSQPRQFLCLAAPPCGHKTPLLCLGLPNRSFRPKLNCVSLRVEGSFSTSQLHAATPGSHTSCQLQEVRNGIDVRVHNLPQTTTEKAYFDRTGVNQKTAFKPLNGQLCPEVQGKQS